MITLMLLLVETLPILMVLLDFRRGTSLYDQLLKVQEQYVRGQFEVDAGRTAGTRIAQVDDPDVDAALKDFDEREAELTVATRQTMATVVQLAERRAASG